MRELERELRLPEALCRLLAVRGLTSPEKAKDFLRPLLADLHDPSRLLGAEAAADRLAHAVRSGEMVVVHGDYDVDGISGAALLTLWVRALGGRAEAIVPDRLRHGYDLSRPGVGRAAELGAALLVTVDCGIVALEPARLAAEAGIDLIVTDHHTPGPELPSALAVVNPNRPGCAYPNKSLSGCGVAFKVGQLLAAGLGRPADESWEYLDLVALATIADQMPLVGENRILARYGLRQLARTGRPGLRALMEEARVRPDEGLEAGDVAFRLAPRINAAGRVGNSDSALRLLLGDDSAEVGRLARRLESDNSARRELEGRATEEALAEVRSSYDPARDRAVVIDGEGWHPGVIGIVASRIAERIFRPTIVISVEGDRGRGSGRSIPHFDLHGAISRCADLLERFGGHHQAAGLDIRRDRIPAFARAFQEEARRDLGDAIPRPSLDVELEVSLEEVTPELCRYYGYAGPYGRGNPEPILMARGVRVERGVRVLNGGHLAFHVERSGARLRAIGFGMAERVDTDSLEDGPVDLAFTLLREVWRGHPTVSARVAEIRPSECAS